jgi:predicted metal-dependent hydrolase
MSSAALQPSLLEDYSGPSAVGVPPAGEVEIRRSPRRRRTVSAYRENGRTVVLIPARMSRAEERHWVALMLERLAAQEKKLRPSDAELMTRARELSRRHLDGRARPATVRWVSNQTGRWGSCTPVDRSIRLSDRLQGMPEWVVDYVLLHELAHLLVPGHGPAFWALLESYPRLERARGYLEGVAGAAGLALSDD